MQTKAGTFQSPGFWQKLTSPEPNAVQIIFDFTFGVFVPLLCFLYDPGLLRNGDFCFSAPLGHVSIFVYTASAIGMAALTLWLVGRSRFQRAAAFFNGIFLAGLLFSLGLGFAMLPFSLVGVLIYGLGLLGFLPFLTALVFWFNYACSWKIATQLNIPAGFQFRLAVSTLALIIVLGIPALAQWQLPQLFPTLAFVAHPNCSD